jgi:fatty-acyl-CoA synthase
MRSTVRRGWYWSGDLAYVDEDGWLFFAGRSSDWIRVDGENFAAAPIDAIIGRHPDIVLVAAYGVPDADAGDQVMVALVLRDGATFEGGSFATWLDGQPDLSPKWHPRFVRLCGALPCTPTNKILTRTLVHERFRSDRIGGDVVHVRERGSDSYRVFDANDEEALHRSFVANGRDRFWDT